MSEETTQITPGETATITGEGTVTTDGDLQTTVTASPEGTVVTPNGDTLVTDQPTVQISELSGVGIVTPVEQPVVEVIPPVLTPEAQAIADGPVVSQTNPAPIVAADSSAPEVVVVMYNGKQVTKRFGLFDADGSEECELADGSTAFVPKSVLGE